MIAVTGAHGYVGSTFRAHARARGIETVALTRSPSGPDERPYHLAARIGEEVLGGVTGIVHAAYDLRAPTRASRALNFEGSLPLLRAAHERLIPVVLVSSLACFKGCASTYGAVKLALEHEVLGAGGSVVRPGIVFGTSRGGLFGSLVRAVSSHRVLPLVASGSERLFFSHDVALSELMVELLGRPASGAPVFAAHRAPSDLEGLVNHLSRALGRPTVTIRVPPRPLVVLLRAAERLGLNSTFRSDSLVSLEHPAPEAEIEALLTSPVEFPSLQRELWFETGTSP